MFTLCSERKIDLLDHRLEAVTKLLEDLKTQMSGSSTSKESHYDPSRTTTAVSTITSSPNHSESASGLVVEGESSLSAHTVFVNEFVQNFVDADPLRQTDPEIRSTINVLSHIVSDSKQRNGVNEPVLAHARPQDHLQQERRELPPISKTVSLIRIAKAQRLAGSGWIYEYITMQPFGDLCLEVYFSEDYSPFDFISVNAGLYSLFWDYACVADLPQNEKEQYIAYSRLCRDNLETGLANLPLHLPASSNVIAALLFAAFYAIEFSKSMLCWTLSSKASELCQTLGYHRNLPLGGNQQSGDARYTQFLFWSTYYIDKSLSLRLGRASTIPDWDISISLPSLPNKDQEPVLAYFVLWIKLARCQGNIYEMLYSPGSMIQPDHVRHSRVELLRSNLQELEEETERTMNDWFKVSKENSGENLMDFYATSDAILRLSLLTHVYRAAPRTANSSTTFSSDCVRVARATIEKHHECMAIIHKSNNLHFSTYIHWTLLFAPFIPFIAIFCNVMETRDKADLVRLDAFIMSIQSASTVSGPAAKMHRLFQVLYNIAARYLELHTQSNPDESSVPETEAQLAALGFPHARTWTATQQHQTQSSNLLEEMETGLFHETSNMGVNTDETSLGQWAVNPMFWMGNGAQLENWLYDNQASMELLQEVDLDSPFKE
ncbi:fungal-specific transcription factor domain-containing protein [Pyrenochaeta sp. MPI-SDFR-AT-0127]|nr:fungal-specific transcription factor domain-containing protein [Pyrenochaeta sp. MPI-SDFR-AT-0127]